ncbi:MAG: hypothetical protein ACREOI_32480 [bacterium]
MSAPLAAFGEGVSCLLNNEHNKDAQFSSPFPVRHSASPHMNMEAVKQMARSKPAARQQVVESLSIITKQDTKIFGSKQNKFFSDNMLIIRGRHHVFGIAERRN